MSTTQDCYDVLIVGCGISGLAAGYFLSKKDPQLRMCLLEGRDRLGGRLKTIVSPSSGKVIDVGGMWIGPLQENICELVENLRIPTYPQYLKGKNVHDDGKRLHYYKGTIPNISTVSLLDTHFMLGKLESMIQKANVEKLHHQTSSQSGSSSITDCTKPVTSAVAALRLESQWENLDGMSLQQFASKQCWTSQARSLLAVATRLVFGLEPEQLSVLYFLSYCKAAGGTRPLLDSDGGGQDSRLSGGTARLLNALADQITTANDNSPADIFTNAVVTEIEYSGISRSNGSSECASGLCPLTTITCADGRIFRAKRVILTAPPSCLERIRYTPQVPPAKRTLWKYSKAGCYTKVVVEFQQPFWRDSGFSGSCVCEHPSIERPISGVFDYCSEGGQYPALCVFIASDSAEWFASLTSAQQKYTVLRNLEHLFIDEKLKQKEKNAKKKEKKEKKTSNGSSSTTSTSANGSAHTDAGTLGLLLCGFHVMDWAHDPDGNPWFGSGGCPVDVTAIGFFRCHATELRTPLLAECLLHGDTPLEDGGGGIALNGINVATPARIAKSASNTSSSAMAGSSGKDGVPSAASDEFKNSDEGNGVEVEVEVDIDGEEGDEGGSVFRDAASVDGCSSDRGDFVTPTRAIDSNRLTWKSCKTEAAPPGPDSSPITPMSPVDIFGQNTPSAEEVRNPVTRTPPTSPTKLPPGSGTGAGARAGVGTKDSTTSKIPVVFFAGTETALCWTGYMEGAVESAKRVSAEVISSFSMG